MSKTNPTKDELNVDEIMKGLAQIGVSFLNQLHTPPNPEATKAESSSKTDSQGAGEWPQAPLIARTEIQQYCLQNGLTDTKAKVAFVHKVAYLDDDHNYQILTSPKVTENTFVVGAFVLGTHKVALAFCDVLTPLKSITRIFSKLWENNTPAILKVAIVSGTLKEDSKALKIQNFIEEHNNIELYFHDTEAHRYRHSLSIDTEGNFSTDCRNIAVDTSTLPSSSTAGMELAMLFKVAVSGQELPLENIYY